MSSGLGVLQGSGVGERSSGSEVAIRGQTAARARRYGGGIAGGGRCERERGEVIGGMGHKVVFVGVWGLCWGGGGRTALTVCAALG